MTSLRVVGTAVVDDDEQPTFDSFWLLYPKKVAKFDATRAWKRLSYGDQMDAIVGLIPWRQVWMRRGEMQFVPHAASWLNGHRWEDELPDQWISSASHASHAPAAIPEPGAKTVMPDHVRAYIAKLKK